MALTRKQFREGFCKDMAEMLTKICRQIDDDRKRRGDKSRLEIPLFGAVLVFPRRR